MELLRLLAALLPEPKKRTVHTTWLWNVYKSPVIEPDKPVEWAQVVLTKELKDPTYSYALIWIGAPLLAIEETRKVLTLSKLGKIESGQEMERITLETKFFRNMWGGNASWYKKNKAGTVFTFECPDISVIWIQLHSVQQEKLERVMADIANHALIRTVGKWAQHLLLPAKLMARIQDLSSRVAPEILPPTPLPLDQRTVHTTWLWNVYEDLSDQKVPKKKEWAQVVINEKLADPKYSYALVWVGSPTFAKKTAKAILEKSNLAEIVKGNKAQIKVETQYFRNMWGGDASWYSTSDKGSVLTFERPDINVIFFRFMRDVPPARLRQIITGITKLATTEVPVKAVKKMASLLATATYSVADLLTVPNVKKLAEDIEVVNEVKHREAPTVKLLRLPTERPEIWAVSREDEKVPISSAIELARASADDYFPPPRLLGEKDKVEGLAEELARTDPDKLLEIDPQEYFRIFKIGEHKEPVAKEVDFEAEMARRLRRERLLVTGMATAFLTGSLLMLFNAIGGGGDGPPIVGPDVTSLFGGGSVDSVAPVAAEETTALTSALFGMTYKVVSNLKMTVPVLAALKKARTILFGHHEHKVQVPADMQDLYVAIERLGESADPESEFVAYGFAKKIEMKEEVVSAEEWRGIFGDWLNAIQRLMKHPEMIGSSLDALQKIQASAIIVSTKLTYQSKPLHMSDIMPWPKGSLEFLEKSANDLSKQVAELSKEADDDKLAEKVRAIEKPVSFYGRMFSHFVQPSKVVDVLPQLSAEELQHLAAFGLGTARQQRRGRRRSKFKRKQKR